VATARKPEEIADLGKKYSDAIRMAKVDVKSSDPSVLQIFKQKLV
jgi:hypothetical protein